MIAASVPFDQSTLAYLQARDPVVQRYRAFFAVLDWTCLPERDPVHPPPGPCPHPLSAYIKALLVKLCEGKQYVTHLRQFLLEHPLLILELGFHPVLDPSQPYGFVVQTTLPCARWLRHQQQTLSHSILTSLLHATVAVLQNEIPGLGETIAVDVKHIYAWVREKNSRQYVRDRFDPKQQPSGDPDCTLGVKRSTNQVQADGSPKEKKEYLWGYGSGVVAATTPDYGDVVLAEYTQGFNEADITYFEPLYLRSVASLGFFPTHSTADAAYAAWYVYQKSALHGGIAAVPLNQHGHPTFPRDADGVPRCPKALRMVPTFTFAHPNGYQALRYRCPLLFPEKTGETCDHAQFVKGCGCVKDVNHEKGGQMRVTLDRTSPLYKAIYRQRTSCERINSQAKELGIERPKVRNRHSVHRLNTLTYIIINAKAIQRVQSINARLLLRE
ncbi:MAG: hypothetical protein NVS9B9_27280 [Ktedonobacteraceae bacterium]